MKRFAMIPAVLVAVVFLATSLALPVSAQNSQPKSLGTFKDWNAFQIDMEGATWCYIVSTPQDSKPRNVNRGVISFIVADVPEKDTLEPSANAGYPFKVGSAATVTIGSDKFELFTDNQGAWARDEATETRLVNAMRRGATMIVTGTSRRGTLTTDRYSLSGVTAGLKAISENCPQN